MFLVLYWLNELSFFDGFQGFTEEWFMFLVLHW
jgi:hypothetical protein